MCRRFARPSKKATAPAPTKFHRFNARHGVFAGHENSSKKATLGNRFFYGRQDSRLLHRPGVAGANVTRTVEIRQPIFSMADKTQACAADQVAREMTTQELLNEVLKAELRQLPG